jgi:hypothetical protein
MSSSSHGGSDLSQGNRRISTRSIKRKKFDDELVESSLIKSDRVRPKPQLTNDSKLVMPVVNTIAATTVSGERTEAPLSQPVLERKKIHKVTFVI